MTLRKTLQPTSAVVDYLSTFLIRPCRVANIPCAQVPLSVQCTLDAGLQQIRDKRFFVSRIPAVGCVF